jgi:hypothetical protein
MKSSRIASWSAAVVAVSGLAWWMAADAATGATPALSEPQAFSMLASTVAAHGQSIPKGLETYVHFGDGVVAHAPLAGIDRYTEEDFAAGVEIMALVVSMPVTNLVPNGAYVVKAQFDPGAATGKVSFLNAEGQAVATAPAYARSYDEITQVLPGAYDPPPPPMIPNITSTHVFYHGHLAVDCSGWDPPRTIYYLL